MFFIGYLQTLKSALKNLLKLAQSILNSLPLYYFSLLKAPVITDEMDGWW